MLLLVWIVAGFALALGLAALPSIGLPLVLLAAFAVVLLVRRPSWRGGWPGALVGAGLPLLYVAFLNRSGPGTSCTTSGSSQSCVDQLSPWPWLVAGVVLIAAGVLLVARRRTRQDDRHELTAPGPGRTA